MTISGETENRQQQRFSQRTVLIALSIDYQQCFLHEGHRTYSSVSDNDTSVILHDIFANYDKRVIPFTDGPVVINMTIVLGILVEVRENEQLAAYVISHTQRWYDRRLQWDPNDYRGQKEVIVPQSMVWIPKLFVYNSLESKEMLTSNRADVRLHSDGAIKVNIPQYVSAICRIQTQSFPFDCQFCAVALASPLLNVQEMIVDATQPPKDSYFAGNAEWYLFNVTVRHMEFVEEGESRVEVIKCHAPSEVNQSYTNPFQVHYIFHLQRRPIYYITVIVAPTFLISALSILGIFSPGSSDGPRNEKASTKLKRLQRECITRLLHSSHLTQSFQVSLGLGSLLAMTVLLGIVAGAMPKSNSIPLLGYYILIVILLCAIAVSISMAFLAISRQYIQKDQMPSKRILRFMLIPESRKRRSTVNTTNSFYPYPDKECSSPKVPELVRIYNVLEEIADSHRNMRRKTEQKLHRKAVQHEWAKVFSHFDYFFLFVFELLNLAALAVFLRVAWLPTPELRDQIL
ncbi:unnamed protein product [Nippostrongylus brasiliensis]|uniref:Neur_chan_LBD domain-containing protein n=1 Tax=Nippostrongylus brasiliensis TaxID=27835 RepID=A0A0N4XV66_NIPBR|nr:unnamed protein product [Nippostrongylus brasiliensis]